MWEKVPGGFELGTPWPIVQRSNYRVRTTAADSRENLWYLCTNLINVYCSYPDPDPDPRREGQLPNPKSATLL